VITFPSTAASRLVREAARQMLESLRMTVRVLESDAASDPRIRAGAAEGLRTFIARIEAKL